MRSKWQDRGFCLILATQEPKAEFLYNELKFSVELKCTESFALVLRSFSSEALVSERDSCARAPGVK